MVIVIILFFCSNVRSFLIFINICLFSFVYNQIEDFRIKMTEDKNIISTNEEGKIRELEKLETFLRKQVCCIKICKPFKLFSLLIHNYTIIQLCKPGNFIVKSFFCLLQTLWINSNNHTLKNTEFSKVDS